MSRIGSQLQGLGPPIPPRIRSLDWRALGMVLTSTMDLPARTSTAGGNVKHKQHWMQGYYRVPSFACPRSTPRLGSPLLCGCSERWTLMQWCRFSCPHLHIPHNAFTIMWIWCKIPSSAPVNARNMVLR